jgi:hypothetical protein
MMIYGVGERLCTGPHGLFDEARGPEPKFKILNLFDGFVASF